VHVVAREVARSVREHCENAEGGLRTGHDDAHPALYVVGRQNPGDREARLPREVFNDDRLAGEKGKAGKGLRARANPSAADKIGIPARSRTPNELAAVV